MALIQEVRESAWCDSRAVDDLRPLRRFAGAAQHSAEDRHELGSRMAAREVEEALFSNTMIEVSAQHFLEEGWDFRERHVAPHFAADAAPVAIASTHENVVALDHVVPSRDLRTEKADISNIVLGAGVRAAGQVDVDRLIELEPSLKVSRDLLNM